VGELPLLLMNFLLDPLAYLEVMADETMKPPTPTSIREIPKVSVFANFLGNILKSTARIHIHVINMIEPKIQ
jgi:hypothetical protein